MKGFIGFIGFCGFFGLPLFAVIIIINLVVHVEKLDERISELESKVCIQGTVGCKPLGPGWESHK